MISAEIKQLILSLLEDFFRNSTPAWSFVYYSNAIFWKNKRSSEFYPALLVCKMAIFQLFATHTLKCLKEKRSYDCHKRQVSVHSNYCGFSCCCFQFFCHCVVYFICLSSYITSTIYTLYIIAISYSYYVECI